MTKSFSKRETPICVQICAGDGSILWGKWQGGGVASAAYLRDGTQQQIIRALSDAIDQAQAELSCLLNTPYVVLDGGTATSKINRDIPVSRAWDHEPGGKHLVETSVVSMPAATPETLKVRVVSKPHITLVVARHDDNVTFVEPFARMDKI